MDFIQKTLNLLQLERSSELEESLNNRSNSSVKELEKQGICISKLLVASVKTGLFDRVLVKLKKEFTVLPPNKITAGDLVGVFTDDIKNPDYQGTVYKVTNNHIVLAGDSNFEEPQIKVSIVLLANEATYKRQRDTLERLRNLSNKEIAFDLSEVILGNSPAKLHSVSNPLTFINPSLNSIQQNAVKFVLDNCSSVGIIHGPPGTGKTTTVVEVIKQATIRGLKVLATAPSNIAVDNLVEKLQDLRIVRIGHPARMLESIVQHSFDSLIKKTDSYNISKDIRKDINMLSKTRSNRNELNSLRRELRERENKAADEVLSNAQVVLATCISSANHVVEKYSKDIAGFDLVVIDEAAQALECACWVPILMGKKVILAGDHKQLPPTIISKQAAREGLQVSMMERLCTLYPEVSVLLEVQYRMNSCIMNWSNHEFYSDRLVADDSVKDSVLSLFPHPLVLVDTSGGQVWESGEISKYNPGEAEIVEKLVKEIQGYGVSDVSVITPYNAQVDLLKNTTEKIEISTVDGFQGREKEVIIISMVRSNSNRQVGFLDDFRRLNVAVTRAKKMVCVVMDGDTVANPTAPAFLKSFVKYFRDNAVCLNFHEYFTGGVETKNFKIENKRGAKKDNQKPEKPEKSGKNEKKVENPESPPVKKWVDPLQECKKLIEKFLKSDQEDLKTEPLDAKERHEIHVMCEKLKVYHKTLGNSKQTRRSMFISKETPQRENKINHFVANFEVETQEEEKQEQPVFEGKTKLKKETLKEEYNEDQFLEQAIKEAAFCMKTGCKKNIEIMKTVCAFCHRGFCFQHGLAEAHGCAERAHLSELHAPPRPAKLQDTKINELKGRLHDKIEKVGHKKTEKKGKKKK